MGVVFVYITKLSFLSPMDDTDALHVRPRTTGACRRTHTARAVASRWVFVRIAAHVPLASFGLLTFKHAFSVRTCVAMGAREAVN